MAFHQHALSLFLSFLNFHESGAELADELLQDLFKVIVGDPSRLTVDDLLLIQPEPIGFNHCVSSLVRIGELIASIG